MSNVQNHHYVSGPTQTGSPTRVRDVLKYPSYYSLAVSAKLVGFLVIDRQEVGAGVVGPQWTKELFEGRVEAGSNPLSQQKFGGRGNRMDGRTILGRAGTLQILVALICSCGLPVERWAHPGRW